MKKLIVPIIIIVVAVVIGFVYFNKSKVEDEVSTYVNNNTEELVNIAKEYLGGNVVDYPEDIKKVTEYQGEFTDIVIFEMNDNYGFYYSTKNLPAAYKNIKTDLIELGGNKYKWMEDTNKGTTIKIKDNWYFYKLDK